MIRFWLVAMLSTVMMASVAAQTAWNPNSPQAQRNLRASPPPPAPPTQVGETIEAERWRTHSSPYSQPQWGTVGGGGRTGVTREAGQATR